MKDSFASGYDAAIVIVEQHYTRCLATKGIARVTVSELNAIFLPILTQLRGAMGTSLLDGPPVSKEGKEK